MSPRREAAQGGPIRARTAILVVAGFIAGALTAYYLLWRTHALVPGHPLALRTSEILSPPARPPRTVALLPALTPIGTPTAAPTPRPTPGVESGR